MVVFGGYKNGVVDRIIYIKLNWQRTKLDHIHKEKGENLHLRQRLEHNNKIIEQLQKSTKTVYVAKEKPFTKLSGRPTKDKDPIISDWLEDAREHLVTIPDEKSRIDFLMQNLISPAKDEIRLRPLLERDTADKILYLIHSIYDGDDSVTQLQELFFQRNQKDDEKFVLLANSKTGCN